MHTNPFDSFDSFDLFDSSHQKFTERKANAKLMLGNGKACNEAGQFKYPWGIAFDRKHQKIVVSDGDNHRVQYFNRSDLKHLASVGSQGNQKGKFKTTRGLCIQPTTNHLLVCDQYNHRVQILSDQGQPLYMIGSGRESQANGEFYQPFGVCCAPDGTIVVAEYYNHRVQLLDAGGRFVYTFGTQGSGPQQLNEPLDLCYLAPPFSPSSSASALLLVADWGNKRLSIWSADGRQPISQIPVADHAHGVCADLNGLVYVSYASDVGMVQICDPRHNYSLLQTLGGEGDAAGQFNDPVGMCVDNTNTLMVVDYAKNCVKFFD
jgi:DNA-binding beta-propeller fold protein YncE